MAKKRISKKRKKRNLNRKELSSTTHAPLCALAPVIAERELLSPIHTEVTIDQKQILYRPSDKLVFATLGFIAGAETVSDLNFQLRPNSALLKAFGYSECADQSVISETINAATAENVAQLEKALLQIWQANNQTTPLLEATQKGGDWVTLDMDLSGQPASAKAQHSTKGYFTEGKNTTGRQLARVVVAATQEIVTESLYPGNRLSMEVLKDQLVKVETVMDLQTQADRSRVRLRLDAGFGTDENLNYVLWRGYHILAKVFSWQRSHKLAKSVTIWVAMPSKSGETQREVGWVEKPHRYGRKTVQVAIRTPKKNSGYSYHILVSTNLQASLKEIVTDYDKRSGAPESTFCQDYQGLSLKKRRKKRFVAQQMLILLSQLAHNLIRWMQSWLVSAVEDHSAPASKPGVLETGPTGQKVLRTLRERGIKRFITQILSLDGRVVFKNGKVKQIYLNPLYPLIDRIITAFQALLKPLKIKVSLDEI